MPVPLPGVIKMLCLARFTIGASEVNPIVERKLLEFEPTRLAACGVISVWDSPPTPAVVPNIPAGRFSDAAGLIGALERADTSAGAGTRDGDELIWCAEFENGFNEDAGTLVKEVSMLGSAFSLKHRILVLDGLGWGGGKKEEDSSSSSSSGTDTRPPIAIVDAALVPLLVIDVLVSPR